MKGTRTRPDLGPPLLERDRVLRSASTGRGEEPDPPVHALAGHHRVRPPPVAGQSQPFDVGLGPAGENQRDWRHGVWSDASATQHDVHERASNPAIAVDKRVDRLELGVGDGGLHDSRHRGVVDEAAEIGEELLDQLRRWRDEPCGAGVQTAPADPALLRAQQTGVRRRALPMSSRRCISWMPSIDASVWPDIVSIDQVIASMLPRNSTILNQAPGSNHVGRARPRRRESASFRRPGPRVLARVM